MAKVYKGWAYVSGSGTAGGTNTQIQFNDSGDLNGTGSLTWDGSQVFTTNLSASHHISASAFTGDGRYLTNVTASAVESADGPELSLQFRFDSPIGREMSGSSDLMWLTGSSPYLQVSGAVKVAGNITASTEISASEFYGSGVGLTGIPAPGSDKEVLFNNAGTLGAHSSFTYSTSAKFLNVQASASFSGSGNAGEDVYFGTGTDRSMGRYYDAGDDYLKVGHKTGRIVLSGNAGVEFVADTAEGVGSFGSPFYVYTTQAGSTVAAKMTHQGEISASTSVSASAFHGTTLTSSLAFVSGNHGALKYVKDWGDGPTATTESLGGKVTLGGYGSPYLQTRNIELQGLGSLYNNFDIGHSGQIQLSSSMADGGMDLEGIKFTNNPGQGLVGFSVNRVAFFHNTASINTDPDVGALEYVWSINSDHAGDGEESAWVKLDLSSSTKNFQVGGRDSVQLQAASGLLVDGLGQFNNGVTVGGATSNFNADLNANNNFSVSGDTTIGNAHSDSLIVNASASFNNMGNIYSTASNVVWQLHSGSSATGSGPTQNGPLLFFSSGAAGTKDYLKFHTEGPSPGVVIPNNAYMENVSASANISASSFSTFAGTTTANGLDVHSAAGVLNTTYGRQTITNKIGDFSIDILAAGSSIVLDSNGTNSFMNTRLNNNGIGYGGFGSGSYNDQAAFHYWTEGIEGSHVFKASRYFGENHDIMILDPKAAGGRNWGLTSVSGALSASHDISASTLHTAGDIVLGGPTGRVGIGTDSPSFLLHISGSNSTARAFVASDNGAIDILPSNGPAINFGTPADSDAYMKIGTFSSRNQIWLNNAAYDFQISASVGGIGYYFDQSHGRVGIGTNAPGRQFEIYNETSAVMKFEAADHSGYSIGSDGYGFIIYDDDMPGGGTGGYVFTLAETSGRRGYVGIGNGLTGPEARLHVSSSLESANRGVLRVDGDASDGILFVTGSGRVGIGTTSPRAPLHVSSSSDEALFTVDGQRGADPVLVVTGAQGVGINTDDPKLALDVHYSGNLNPVNLPSGQGGGEVAYFGTASAEMSAGALYYLNADQGWMSVNSAFTGSGHDQLLGIALGVKPSRGILLRGYFNVSTYFSGSFIPGGPMYIQSSSVPRADMEGGCISGAAPTGGNSYVRVVGYGTDTANVIYFNPSSTYVEISGE